MYQFPADELKLFLAKQGDAWLVSNSPDVISMRSGVIPKHVKKLLNEEIDPTEEIGDLFGGAPTKKVIHVLVVVPEGAGSPENKRKRKRMEDENVPDAWIKALKDEQVTVLPSTCEDLKAHLQRELRAKVPIDDTLRGMALNADFSGECLSIFNKLFEPEPREKLSPPTCVLVTSAIAPSMPRFENATENTYIHLWDTLITGPLMYVSNGTFLRNTNTCTSTGLYRPDLCFYFGNSNLCVFCGEGKASGLLQVPVDELHDKLTWRYDDAPYVFGYAAVGLTVCLVAIQKDKTTEHGVRADIIERYDLGNKLGRLSLLLAMLNLSTLFRPIVNLVKPLGIVQYGTITRSNGVHISFAENCVMKTYPSTIPSGVIIRNLTNWHGQMKRHSVPNVVELLKTNMKKRHVVLAPVGKLCPPKNIHELLTALRDILKALVKLHSINLMHRDLRWDNVLKYPGEGERWFLIDFDDGATSPAAKTDHLKAESHAPEILLDSPHSVEVDI
ncbi:hypothetical protein V7S43_000510 [Phytophthora oleae]|uniref:Protein kinase domain-containing protein n=1 Tax=Phytophthora oleae TaxID=2107226 RepID=A0ABD3G7G2_9STRA